MCEVSASPLSLKTFVCVCESACVCIYEKDSKGKTENFIEYENEYSDHVNRRRDRKKLTKIDGDSVNFVRRASHSHTS